MPIHSNSYYSASMSLLYTAMVMSLANYSFVMVWLWGIYYIQAERVASALLPQQFIETIK